jgi:hypothetical protein
MIKGLLLDFNGTVVEDGLVVGPVGMQPDRASPGPATSGADRAIESSSGISSCES